MVVQARKQAIRIFVHSVYRLLRAMTILAADEFANCDHQVVDAFVGLTKPFVGLAHPPVCFFELFRHSIEPPARLRRQVSDQFL